MRSFGYATERSCNWAVGFPRRSQRLSLWRPINKKPRSGFPAEASVQGAKLSFAYLGRL